MDAVTPTNEIEQAYRAFACHLIATVYEDLKSWAIPFRELKQFQKDQLSRPFPETELHEIQLFFLGSGEPQQKSGMLNLLEGLKVQLEAQKILTGARPMLIRAMVEANNYRETLGLAPYPIHDGH